MHRGADGSGTILITEYLTPPVLVILAGSLQALGYIIINQWGLRLLVMLGSVVYIAYYAVAAETPLWDAMFVTLVLMAANGIGMLGLWLRNARFSVPRQFADIYPDFAPLLPGDFRKLMRLSNRRHLTKQTTLSREGATMDKVYYVITGLPVVTKMGATFPMAERIFVGEVAYLTGKGSAATTTVPAGTELLEWNVKALQRAAKRKPQVKLALDAVISRDLARKVALAVAPTAHQAAHPPVETRQQSEPQLN